MHRQSGATTFIQNEVFTETLNSNAFQPNVGFPQITYVNIQINTKVSTRSRSILRIQNLIN